MSAAVVNSSECVHRERRLFTFNVLPGIDKEEWKLWGLLSYFPLNVCCEGIAKEASGVCCNNIHFQFEFLGEGACRIEQAMLTDCWKMKEKRRKSSMLNLPVFPFMALIFRQTKSKQSQLKLDWMQELQIC
jgi:hypothetical protein